MSHQVELNNIVGFLALIRLNKARMTIIETEYSIYGVHLFN